MVGRRAYHFYAFLSPWIVGFLGLTVFPFLYSLYTSFTRWNGVDAPQFIGSLNYQLIFRDQLFQTALINTIYYAVGSVVLGVIVALVLASLLDQKIRLQHFFRTLFFLPYVTAGVPLYIVWSWLFNAQFGVINWLLGLIGIHGPPWLASPSWAMPAIILMSATGTGGLIVVFLAGLQGIPDELYEAARVDGAGTWAQFWRITVPLLSPVILFNTIWSIIGAFQVFTPIYVMTGGGPENATLVVGLYIYQMAFSYFRFGYASAMAWILLAIILGASLVVFATSRRWVYYQGT